MRERERGREGVRETGRRTDGVRERERVIETGRRTERERERERERDWSKNRKDISSLMVSPF